MNIQKWCLFVFVAKCCLSHIGNKVTILGKEIVVVTFPKCVRCIFCTKVKDHERLKKLSSQKFLFVPD